MSNEDPETHGIPLVCFECSSLSIRLECAGYEIDPGADPGMIGFILKWVPGCRDCGSGRCGFEIYQNVH